MNAAVEKICRGWQWQPAALVSKTQRAPL